MMIFETKCEWEAWADDYIEFLSDTVSGFFVNPHSDDSNDGNDDKDHPSIETPLSKSLHDGNRHDAISFVR